MAAKPLPDPELLRKLLSYDPKTGRLTWLPRPVEMFKSVRAFRSWNITNANQEAFVTYVNGYRNGHVFKQRLCAHRVIWAMVYDQWPDEDIDHINGVRDDNRLVNLRAVSRTENQRNQKRPLTNSSGVIGVSWNKFSGRWMAHIKVGGKYIHLGRFDHFEDAVAARKAAEIKYGFHENHGR